MPLFPASYTYRHRDRPDVYTLGGFLIEAASHDVALRKARVTVFKIFPEADGYSHHCVHVGSDKDIIHDPQGARYIPSS